MFLFTRSILLWYDYIDKQEKGTRIMNKTELVKAVAAALNISYKESAAAVNAVIETIASTLATGDKVILLGFGTFEVRQHPAGQGLNPHTGELVTIAVKKTPAFRPGKDLKDKVNG